MFYEVISKRTSALNQLRDGLKVLGVLEVIENNPELCAPLFIYDADSITSARVKSVLRFESCTNEFTQHFLRYITSCEKNNLENFIKFVTGASVLPTTIIVKVLDGSDGVFASTCSKEITLPKNITDYTKLCELLDTVIQPGIGKLFTAV